MTIEEMKKTIKERVTSTDRLTFNENLELLSDDEIKRIYLTIKAGI